MTGTINAIENNINHNIQGAIFDVDGTLLDSMSVWEDIGERYLISLGIMAKDGLGDALHTMSLEQGAVYLKEEYRLEKTVPQIVKEVLKIVSDFYRFEAPLKPGVKETLEWMSKQQIRMVVATSGNKELVEVALDRNGILKYFEWIYTCTEVGAGKDEPEIYLKAAETLQAEPENIVAFEDAFHAAETAKKAGFRVIGVYDVSNEENISRMREVCDCYYDRMDEVIKYDQVASIKCSMKE